MFGLFCLANKLKLKKVIYSHLLKYIHFLYKNKSTKDIKSIFAAKRADMTSTWKTVILLFAQTKWKISLDFILG